MNIHTIIEEVLTTRVLASRQERQIDALLSRQQFSEHDLELLDQLIDLLSQRQVVTGGNSLTPISQA